MRFHSKYFAKVCHGIFFSGATLPYTAPTPMTTCTRESFKVHHIENQHKNTRYACNKEKKLPAIGIVPVISCNNNNIEDHWLPGNHYYRSSFSWHHFDYKNQPLERALRINIFWEKMAISLYCFSAQQQNNAILRDGLFYSKFNTQFKEFDPSF